MNESAKRLERIIETDLSGAVNRTLRVAESDVAMLLGEYMEVSSLDMKAQKTKNGYTVDIRVEASRFYGIGNTSAVE